jgi:alpha-mannosidase
MMLGQTRTVHIISHTHWDREWYLPFEKFHVRLVKLMDVLIDKLENESDYKSFHLDGQTDTAVHHADSIFEIAAREIKTLSIGT